MTKPHIAPPEISKEVEQALSFYPQLQQIPIEFRFKKKIRKSFMQAQPLFRSLINPSKKRKYLVLISEKMEIENHRFSINEMDTDVLIGWLGHELGHIVDYQRYSNLGLIIFGLRYLIQQPFLKEAERRADQNAIQSGMYDYIIATKNFILNHVHLSDTYKNRIKRLYLSPEEIVHMVNEMDKGEIEKEVNMELQKR